MQILLLIVNEMNNYNALYFAFYIYSLSFKTPQFHFINNLDLSFRFQLSRNSFFQESYEVHSILSTIKHYIYFICVCF
jgi:hypothetical protein